jgi:hypothetical protein
MTMKEIDMTPDYDRIPFTERLDFQHALIENMLGVDFRSKTRTEQILSEIAWAEEYAKKVSKIIDDKNNTELRDMIFAHNYEKAVKYILTFLK